MTKEEQVKHGERKKARVYMGSTIVGWLFLAIAGILIVQAILNILSAFGILPTGHIFTYLSGPSEIVAAIQSFFITGIVLTLAFAIIAIISTVGLLQEQEWAGGIALILMGLIATTMLLHLILLQGILGSLSLIFDIAAFAIAVLSSVYIAKNFKRFD
ncbi:MAG: hypothetical protein ACTSQI_16640 [Candidatus Helarchaeota archaeon]